MGAKRSLKSNAVVLAEVCKANDERTFDRMRGNDVDAPIPDLRVTAGEDKGSHSLPVAIGRS